MRQRGLRWSAVTAGAVAATLVAAPAATPATAVAAPVAASAGSFRPGSPGLGDPYFPLEGNGGYDALHYDLALSYLPATHHLGGTVTLTARATQNLSRFDLDFQQLTVRAVTVDGAAARWTRHGHELVVTPPAGLPAGTDFRVAVRYDGVPKTIVGSPIVFGSPYGWIYTKDGAFVGCEPNAASTWYPSNDHPSDKATFTFRITVPRGTSVAANGSLTSTTSSGRSSTFVWDETAPMATYLATIDIGKWVFRQGHTPAGTPELVALDPTLLPARGPSTFATVGRITDFWEKKFGPFPFSSTGWIADHLAVGFSLETQTRPISGNLPSSGLASHELAHQWFGDSVSVRDWRQIWLNEGFATYASWLWLQHTGQASVQQVFRYYYDHIPANNGFWRQSIADPGRNTMFSGAVYARGGMTLAALQQRLGDPTFFRVLQTWTREHRYGNATTAQFIATAERVSGRDLGRFFRVWLWQQQKPTRW